MVYKNKKEYLSRIKKFYDIQPEYVTGYFKEEIFKEIIDKIKPQDKIILDVGCGHGFLIKEINFWHPNNKFYGIDISAKNIKKTQAKINYAKFQVADAEELPFADNYFDILFCTDTLEHVYSLDSTLTEFNRVIKPGGLLILCVPNYFNFTGILKIILEKLHICKKNSLSIDSWQQANENFVTYFNLKKRLKNNNFKIKYLKAFNFLQGFIPGLDFGLHKMIELYDKRYLSFLSKWGIYISSKLKVINIFLGKLMLNKYFSSQMVYIIKKV